ncbi:MAG TPA: hypothetical protein PLO89_02655 [Spirochaetota bacterium]|nr:hypothetical protein [Spirochaetota bacterium]
MKNEDNFLEFSTDIKFSGRESLFCFMEDSYKKRDYGGALACLDDTLRKAVIDSSPALSRYYDLTASLLWKIGEREAARLLWLKSCQYDGTNRHSLLSLHLLFQENEVLSNIFELFIKVKLNEYYSLKEEAESNCCLDFFEEERVVDFLSNYWKNNLSDKNLEGMDELELVDYFINLEVFNG